MEEGMLTHPESGSPQGGVVSPLLMNVYLHEVIDTWFERAVLPRLKGRARLVRYADDMVMVFARRDDAVRVLDVLPKRFGKYGLTLHPDKTRLVRFTRPDRLAGGRSGTFDFLGFTHHWGLSRNRKWIVKQRTAKDRFSRSLRRIREECREHRHDPLVAQQKSLGQKLRGHYQYFGVRSNYRALDRLYRETRRAWQKWLSRRSNTGYVDWDRMLALLECFPLPRPVLRR
jgi:RNA-directed DNA polymerase